MKLLRRLRPLYLILGVIVLLTVKLPRQDEANAQNSDTTRLLYPFVFVEKEYPNNAQSGFIDVSGQIVLQCDLIITNDPHVVAKSFQTERVLPILTRDCTSSEPFGHFCVFAKERFGTFDMSFLRHQAIYHPMT